MSLYTKAEFDAALVEITNSLVNFQAGINSKIDSQVTTYLDRNGIWSGKAQTIPTTRMDWTMKTSSNRNSFFSFTTVADTPKTEQYYIGGFLLTQASKSGLMMLVYKDYVQGTNTERMAIGYHCQGFNQTDYQSDCNVVTTVDLAELNGNWNTSEIGQYFYRDGSQQKAVFVPDKNLSVQRTLNDNTEQVIASQSVWTSMSNTRTYDTNMGKTRYWQSAYVNGTQYTLFGFAKKNKFYSLSWKQTMWYKVPFAKTVYCNIAAVDGNDLTSIPSSYISCRPQCDIVLCDIY